MTETPSSLRLRRTASMAVTFLTTLTLVSCGSGGNGGGSGGGTVPEAPPPAPTFTSPGRYIDVTSDRTSILTGRDDTSFIEAVVRDARTDAVVEGAVVTFSTSNDAVATVDATGTITGRTDTVSSATVTLSADDAFDAVVTVAIVDLAPGATYLPSSKIVAFDADAGSMVVDDAPETSGLGPGDVVLSGERAGVLAVVQSGPVRDEVEGTLSFEVKEGTLADAVEALDVDVEGPPVRAVARVSEDGLTIYATDGTPLATSAVGGFSCETDRGAPVDVDIAGSYLDYDVTFTPRVRLSTSGFTVQVFELSVAGRATLDARSGTLTLGTDASAEITCERQLRSFPLAFVPVFGPLGFAPTVTPSFGFEASAEANVGRIAVTGPEVDLGIDAQAGVRYLAGLGFATVSDVSRTGRGVEWGSYRGATDAAFDAKVEPFLKLTFAASANLGSRSLSNFGIAELKAGGSAEVSLHTPLDPLDARYTGPEWTFKATGSGGLGPLLENVQAGIEPVLDFVGIDADLSTLDADLFSFETTLATSPKPKAEASIGRAARGEMSLVAVGTGSNAEVDFVGWTVTGEAGSVVAQAVASGDRAHTRWYPVGAQRGITELQARAYAAPFGPLGLPYAGGAGWVFAETVPNRAFVEIPEGDDVDPGERVPNWIGFTESTIPGDVDQIVVEWNDGTADRSQTVDRQTEPVTGAEYFEAEIDTTFDGEGVHYQYVRVTRTDGTFIDDRSVPFLVGASFERVANVEYLCSCNVFFGNDEGASQDFSTVDGPDADFYLVRGNSYILWNATEPAVDLWIKTVDQPGIRFAIDPLTYQAAGNGRTNGRMTFTVPLDAPNILYYRSDMAPEMGGVFLVLDE